MPTIESPIDTRLDPFIRDLLNEAARIPRVVLKQQPPSTQIHTFRTPRGDPPPVLVPCALRVASGESGRCYLARSLWVTSVFAVSDHRLAQTQRRGLVRPFFFRLGRRLSDRARAAAAPHLSRYTTGRSASAAETTGATGRTGSAPITRPRVSSHRMAAIRSRSSARVASHTISRKFASLENDCARCSLRSALWRSPGTHSRQSWNHRRVGALPRISSDDRSENSPIGFSACRLSRSSGEGTARHPTPASAQSTTRSPILRRARISVPPKARAAPWGRAVFRLSYTSTDDDAARPNRSPVMS